MNTIQYLTTMTNEAREYRKGAVASLQRNKHMNELKHELTQEQVDAVLTDFINFIGNKGGVDYALYSEDLKETD